MSLATIYNTLHNFVSAGLVREIAIGGAKRYFDTNTSNHNHFHIARDGKLMDIDDAAVRVDGLPMPPPGMRIAHVDVVVHLEPRGQSQSGPEGPQVLDRSSCRTGTWPNPKRFTPRLCASTPCAPA